jgi:hypothetical protein
MFAYTTYGLNIRSVLALPELLPGEGAGNVVIRWGKLEQPAGAAARPMHCTATPREVRYFYRGAGTFLVREGREIVVDPAPGVDEGLLRLYLLGPALGLLLHQRGLLTLHASGAAVAGGAIAFLGGSGWGKSTMAAALHARGHGVVADDVMAVDVGAAAGPTVYPGIPRLKLWPDAALSVGEVPETLPRLHPEFAKRSRSAIRAFPQAPLPLRAICILAHSAEIDLAPLPVQDGFVELVRHSYAVQLLDAVGASEAHFGHCARLANRVPVYRLSRPRALETLSAVAELVEARFKGD